MIVNRYRYIEQLSRSKNNGLIKIITGLRRSGKSFLLKKLFHQHLLDEGVREDHILVIDMESRKNREFKNPDYLLDWVEKMMIDYETYYIIIDEVQEVEDFVEVLSSLSVTEGADVYVTGSNSRFLSSDLVTEFRGRGDEIHVWPLSFKEFMTVYDGSKEDGWAEYRLYGGLPQLLTQVGDEKKADFLRRLYRTVYLRDIYERNNIELRPEFEELSKTVASSIGAPVNALNIANTFKSVSNVQSITDKTVSAYLEYMQDAFLIEKSERFDIKGRKYIGSDDAGRRFYRQLLFIGCPRRRWQWSFHVCNRERCGNDIYPFHGEGTRPSGNPLQRYLSRHDCHFFPRPFQYAGKPRTYEGFLRIAS